MRASLFLYQTGDSLKLHRTDSGETNAGLYLRADSAVDYFSRQPVMVFHENAVRTNTPKAEESQPVVVPQKKAILPPEWNFNLNYFSENDLSRAIGNTNPAKDDQQAFVSTATQRPSDVQPKERPNEHLDWFLAIFLVVALLFIWIRLFYGKYFASLANAISSFQLSGKLFREKNILVRRVSIVLDFIYYVMLAVFIFEAITHFGWVSYSLSRFNLYMLLLNIIIIYSLTRIALLRITGSLFLNRSLFSEYIHNTQVINKGTGILLFPLVITGRYFPYPLISTMLIIGIVCLVLALIWKGIRGYQIIRRKDIVLFYLILYLCTLEFLPLILGCKIIISLI
jgi:hypothetical protein